MPTDAGHHTLPLERADALDDPGRCRFCSREELIELLDPAQTDVVADLGSGTGFYTREVAPFVRRLYAIDVQPAMHERFRAGQVPGAVTFVTASIAELPLPADHLDGAVSTMTHHEYVAPGSFAELARVLRPDAPLVTVDWSGDGLGADGPPLAERSTPSAATRQLERAGLEVEIVRTRPETFAVRARR